MREKQSGLNFTSKYLVICGNGVLAIGLIAIAADWVFSDRLSDIGYSIIIATNMLALVIGGFAALLGKALLAIEAPIQSLERQLPATGLE